MFPPDSRARADAAVVTSDGLAPRPGNLRLVMPPGGACARKKPATHRLTYGAGWPGTACGWWLFRQPALARRNRSRVRIERPHVIRACRCRRRLVASGA